ncbi:DNA damage-repair/toleration protein DRT100-like [Lotus japonicus]|uniref:DNA damage-repair/toleration protein DRT100-like n=1 Tax=Lotus japonicus TaxID=34305 RepID=UPI00258F7E83|nr:DNA damage-repair/toleration protein DRT100-like [Lotus japonicus]
MHCTALCLSAFPCSLPSYSQISQHSISSRSMGVVRVPFLPLTALLVLLLTVTSTVHSCPPSDLAALHAFRSSLREPHNGVLNSWTGTDCCANWFGIACDKNTRHVSEINLRAGSVDTTFEQAHEPAYMAGHISPEICKLTQLSSLTITDWQGISGEIPGCVSSLTFLRIIDLTGNRISGALPANIGKLRQLTRLSIADNLIAGNIPPSLTYATRLTHIDLRNNKISGPIPQSLGRLRMLSHVGLSGNQLTGPIPSSISEIPRLADLDLSQNQLSGPIPEPLGRMAVLSTLKFDMNKLSGTIPASLLVSEISDLNLSHNMLEGEIPNAFGAKTYFTSMDFSYNNLKGPIPKSISSSSYIGYLDFSHNHLCGPIPSGDYLDHVDASSFASNDCLCEKPLKVC